MDLSLIVKGFVIGFSIAAPVGPIGILCMRRTLAYGRIVGFTSGLGAATADAFYGAIAAFGLTLISNLLIAQKFWLQCIGGFFLIYLGVKIALSQEAASSRQQDHSGLVENFLSTFFLTLTNPTTILSFLVIFAGLGLGTLNNTGLAGISMVLGVFFGSASWWLLLSFFIGFLHHKVSPHSMKMINILSGSIIALLGIFILLQSLFGGQ